MTRRESIELIGRALKLTEAETLDVATGVAYDSRDTFCDGRRFAADNAMMLRSPHVIGWAGEVRPGEFTTKNVMGRSVLVSRTRDGVLRAFVNACAHRGAEVAQGCGSARTFTCSYHGWVYGLDGRLAGAPAQKMFDPADRRGLEELPISEQCGLLVVGLSSDVCVDGHLDDIADPLSEWNFGQRRLFNTRRIDVAANWKLNVSINFEGYHFKYTHTETVDPLFSNHSTADVFGRHVRWGFPLRDIDQFRDKPVEEWPEQFHGTVVYFLFPSCVIAEFPLGMQLFRIYPTHAPDRSVTWLSSSTRGDLPEEQRPLHTTIFDGLCQLLIDEDIPAAESCQRGLNSGRDRVVYGRNEPLLQHISAVWREAADQAMVLRGS